MMIRSGTVLVVAALIACSDPGSQGSEAGVTPEAASESPGGDDDAVAANETAREGAADEVDEAAGGEAEATVTEALPLEPEGYVVFIDPGTGFMTNAVHDADREVVHFDSVRGAMVSGATGAAVSGWQIDGADLDWSRFAVPFRVRFGTEQGERRAYFTEAGPGTICNLRFSGPDQLSISATRETPPNP